MVEYISKRLKLPTGRETILAEALRFCYDLSETDATILFKLLEDGEYTVDDLTRALGLTKATINRGLSKLMELGFVNRTRERASRIGRPRFKYYVDDPEKVINKLISDFEECAQSLREVLEGIRKEVLSRRKSRRE
ncbi:MAG: helix-turn-helix domain-containing protein [Thermoproteota archaeon]